MHHYEGVIKSWKADKGFGFIQTPGEAKDIFIHIRDLRYAAHVQPQQGEAVCYKVVTDQNGRIRAYDAFIKGQDFSRLHRTKSFKKSQLKAENNRRDSRLGMLPIGLIAAIPFIFSALLIKQQQNVIPFFVYLVMSLATFLVYAVDKTKAQKKAWRISESTLHLFELLGGWPGALISQHLIRHKNRKTSFQVTFWAIAVIHTAFWLYALFINSASIESVLSRFYNI